MPAVALPFAPFYCLQHGGRCPTAQQTRAKVYQCVYGCLSLIPRFECFQTQSHLGIMAVVLIRVHPEFVIDWPQELPAGPICKQQSNPITAASFDKVRHQCSQVWHDMSGAAVLAKASRRVRKIDICKLMGTRSAVDRNSHTEASSAAQRRRPQAFQRRHKPKFSLHSNQAWGPR